MKKRVLSLSLAGLLVLSNGSNVFAKAWYDDAVKFSKTKSIINEDFKLGKRSSKYDALRGLYLLTEKNPTRENVTKWAVENNLLKDKASLDKVLSRSQMASLLEQYGKNIGLTSRAGDSIKGVKDFEAINKSYLNSLKFAFDSKLIVGDNLGYLNPNADLKEVELLNILMNLNSLKPIDSKEVQASVKEIEKYGHASLDMTIDEFMNKYAFEFGDTVDVVFENGYEAKNIPFLDNYYVDRGETMLRGYKGHETIAICINYGKFNEVAQVKVGDRASIKLNTKAGALALYEMNQLERTNEREDYSSDEVFANFRPIKMGKLGNSALYRTSSPINNEIKRASFADDLIEKAGVKAVLNLADTDEEIQAHIKAEDFDSPYYKSLLDKGQVKVNGLSVNYAGKDFSKKLTEGLKFFTGLEGPYAVHCNEGKDRAGFTSALLSALMGGSVDEIVNDYMKSYENYYHLEKGDKYDIIVNGNIKDMLRVIAGVDKKADLSKLDLELAAEKYLMNNGMTKAEVSKLKENLGRNYAEEIKAEVISAQVEEVSKYGNVTTSASLESFKKAGFTAGDILNVRLGDRVLKVPFGDAYSNVDNKKEIIVADNKSNRVIVAINMGDFAKTYQAPKGTKIEFSMAEKEGYKEEYEIRSIDKYRTNSREDYSSDEVFANFRPIVMGDIKEGVLYRTSSPINPEIARAKFANDLIEKAGVKTVINMADSKEELEGYFSQASFQSPYYKALYDKGQVKYLNMGVDFTSQDFNQKLKEGLIFMSKQAGPFAVHCNEGKDRAGFISIVLEGLMGASVEEIKEDYMLSYMNYYFVEKDSKQYEKIADSNVMKSLKMIAGVKTNEELSKVNLSEKTEEYLKEVIKLDDMTIKNLKAVLSSYTVKENKAA